MDTVHSFHFLFSLGGRSLNPIYFPSYVGLHPTVFSSRLIPSGRACLGMPAHHACSTYVLSLHPRFKLWSRLLPSTSTKVASTIVSCDLQSRHSMPPYSGLPIAELTRTWLTTRGTEEHVEHMDTRNTRTTRTRGEAKTKSMPEPHSTGFTSNTKGAKAPNSGVERISVCYRAPAPGAPYQTGHQYLEPPIRQDTSTWSPLSDRTPAPGAPYQTGHQHLEPPIRQDTSTWSPLSDRTPVPGAPYQTGHQHLEPPVRQDTSTWSPLSDRTPAPGAPYQTGHQHLEPPIRQDTSTWSPLSDRTPAPGAPYQTGHQHLEPPIRQDTSTWSPLSDRTPAPGAPCQTGEGTP